MVILFGDLNGFDIQLTAGKNLKGAAVTVFALEGRAADGPLLVAVIAPGHHGQFFNGQCCTVKGRVLDGHIKTEPQTFGDHSGQFSNFQIYSNL